MTREKIHELLDTVAEHSPHPVKSFQVEDYEFSGEIRVAVTFQVTEPRWAALTATQQQPAPQEPK